MTHNILVAKFLQHLQTTDRVPSESIEVDGQFHRLSWDGEPSEKSGWYVARMIAGLLLISYGDWKGDYKRQWVSKDKGTLTTEERAIYSKAMSEAQKQRAKASEESHMAASIEVRQIWDSAPAAPDNHPYLAKKRISVNGLRQRDHHGNREILVPLSRIDGMLVNLQRILPDSGKFFWKGAQASGVFWAADGLPSDDFEGDIVISEGMATAATVHAISGLLSVAAMNCGNLPKVSALLRKKFPKVRLIIAADDDRWDKNGTARPDDANPGLSHAVTAAKGVKDVVVPPPRTDACGRGTDWNDRYGSIGELLTKAEWDSALKQAELRKTAVTCSEVVYQQQRQKFVEDLRAVSGAEFNEADLDQLRQTERTTQRHVTGEDENQTAILAAIFDEVEFWRDLDGTAHATVRQGPCAVNASVEGTYFKDWLYNRFRDKSKRGFPSSRDSLRGFIESAAARARQGPDQFPAHYRMGYDETHGSHWLDLGREDWEMIRWDGAGWEVAKARTIKFIRSNGKTDLPLPEANPQFSNLGPLWELLNVGAEDRPLIAGFLLNALFSTYPCFGLCLFGGKGSAKSIGSALIRRILDPHPSVSQVLNTPKGHEIGLTCREQWIPVFENVSSLTPEIQDILCALTTGLSEKKRILFTTNDAMSFSVRRPWITNGINNPTTRSDLAERTIPVALLAAPTGSARKTEEYINGKFLKCQPHVLAVLLNAAVASIQNREAAKNFLAQHNLDHRMADALQIITAGEEALGFPMGSFIRRLKIAQRESGEDSLEGNPVLSALQNLLDECPTTSWRGTYQQILKEMHDLDPDSCRQKFIPRTNSTLGNWFGREKDRLRDSFGIIIGKPCREMVGTRKLRVVEIRRAGSDEGDLSQAGIAA